MTKKEKIIINEIEKEKHKEIKKDLKIQELAMEVKNNIPQLSLEESLEEKVMKKKLKEFGQSYLDDEEKEDEKNSIKNLEEDLEDLIKSDDEKEDLPYVTYGEMNKDYEKSESIGNYMATSGNQLSGFKISRNREIGMRKEISKMSEDMRMLQKSKSVGEEYMPNPKKGLNRFKDMSEDYR